jgi:hypothetical protein
VPIDFDTLLTRAWYTYHTAEDAWQAWWFYIGHETRTRYLETFARYPWVVATAEDASFVATIVALGKLYDPDGRAASLSRLVREAEHHGTVPRGVLAAIRTDRREAQRIWRRLQVLRNEHVAHVDPTDDMRTVFERAQVQYNEVERIVDLSRQVLNAFSQALGKPMWFPYHQVTASLKQLWDAVAAGRPRAGG